MTTQDLVLPWRTKEEWILVYNYAYSKNYEEVLSAIETLSDWFDNMKKSRPGMDITKEILQVAIRDKLIFPLTKTPADSDVLKIMYSSVITRFLNLINDSSVKGNKKISMYARAKDMCIPDFIVNIRHHSAHRNSYADIDNLRTSVNFILKWLKTHYWEVEKNEMKEIAVEENINTAIEKALVNLLKVYTSLKDQKLLGYNMVQNIQDPEIQGLIDSIYKFSLQEVIRRSRPNGNHNIDDLNSLNMKYYSIPKFVSLVIKLLKEFIMPEKMFGVNIIDVILEKMIEDSIKHNGMRVDIWNSFLKAIHSWRKFPIIIKSMVDKSYENNGERAHQAGLWGVEFIQALEKRYNVETLRNKIIKDSIKGKFTNKKKKNKKYVKLTPLERKEFMKLLLKKNLNIMGQSDNKILACIFHRIEQKDKNLRRVIRLHDPIFPNHREIVYLIKYIALKPTSFSEQCLQALMRITNWPPDSVCINRLIKLGQIYRGESVDTLKFKKVYQLHHLEDKEKKVVDINSDQQMRENYTDLHKYLNSKIFTSIFPNGNEPTDYQSD